MDRGNFPLKSGLDYVELRGECIRRGAPYLMATWVSITPNRRHVHYVEDLGSFKAFVAAARRGEFVNLRFHSSMTGSTTPNDYDGWVNI